MGNAWNQETGPSGQGDGGIENSVDADPLTIDDLEQM